MNPTGLEQASAAAKDAAAGLKDAAKDVKQQATDAGAGRARDVADDVERTAKDVKQAAKEAGKAAKHVDDVATAAKLAASDVGDLDDIEAIERRMNTRRASIRRHLTDAKGNMERTLQRTTRAWPIAAAGAVVAALAVGYVVAQRARTSHTERTAKSLWRKARGAPEAARRYVHEATKPPSRVWTERLAAGTGFAMAVARALPQLRVLAATIQRARPQR